MQCTSSLPLVYSTAGSPKAYPLPRHSLQKQRTNATKGNIMTLPDPNANPYIWATLITNSGYLPGALTLNYSLKKLKSKYPLIALYTDKLDSSSLQALHDDGIPTLQIENLSPAANPNLVYDKRFTDTWSKLYFFKLTQFKRIIQLDSDMLILQNMDELMTLPLGDHNFASTHACVCNPLKKAHYPSSWTGENCVFSRLVPGSDNEPLPDVYGPNCKLGLSKCNSGLLIVEPSIESFNAILSALEDGDKTQSYLFPDQDLLADVFYRNWLSLSHNYNCLKTYKYCHPQLWDLSKIKNIHFILSPKPWDVDRSYNDESGTFHLWWNENEERLRLLNGL